MIRVIHRLAENFPQDKTDEIELPDSLKALIERFAKDSSQFFDLQHHIDISHEEQITVAVERVMRLLLEGEDADSIRAYTMSPWGPEESI